MIQKAAITAENVFTDEFIIPGLTDPQKKTAFNLSIAGNFVAIVTLKRKLPGESTFESAQTFSSPVQSIVDEIESRTIYIIGVETGDYTSGTVNVRLGSD